MKNKSSQNLYVYMNGILIGTLLREPSNQLVFTYDENWLTHENTRPISLSMPLTEIPYRGENVYNYFDNLLPDSTLIRKRIQTRFNSPTDQCFDLLSMIGTDCVGALQLLTQNKNTNIKTIKADSLSDNQIATLLKHYQTAPLGMDKAFDFRISIAGAQEKTALLWHKEKWHLPKESTPTSHIIKLPIGYLTHSALDLSDSVENEWLCLKILAAYNLPTANANMINFADVKTLAVERFDREWSDNKWLIRLPQEDFCQALSQPSALKYESDGGPGIKDIMQVLIGSQNATIDRKNFMKSVFLFWVLGAIDGHAKNFSISLESQGRYKLTPLYDVISGYPLVAKQQIDRNRFKMAMSLKGNNVHYAWNKRKLRHWFSTAERCQFPIETMREIIDEVCDNMENVIQEVTNILPKNFPASISNSIFGGMREIKNQCARQLPKSK